MALKLSFRDNSEHESGFHVYRSDAPMDPRKLPQPYKDLGRNSSVVIDEDFGGIFDQRRYYRVAAYVKGGNRSVSEEVYAGYDGKSPTLNLNFASLQYAVAQGMGLDLLPRAFSDLITFTRSTGGGRFNAQGQYEWLPANTPRIDYDPVTGECLGLLIEEQRTNLLTYSNDFANAVWAKVGATITTGALTALDAKAANKLVESSENTNHALFSSAAVTNGVSHTVSFVVKAEGRSNVRIRLAATSQGITGTFLADANFDLSNGTYLSGSNTDRSIKHLGSGWYRISVTATSTSTTIGVALMLGTSALTVAYQGDGTSGIYIWGAQLEAGTSPTSRIPTPATFTGRASTGTYFDANGVLKIAAAGEARYTHAYIDGAWVSAGLLIEEQRTNLLTYSSDFTNAVWVKAGVSVAGGIASPDGGSGASRVKTTSANATSPARSVADLTTAGGTYTYSVWLRADTPQSMILQVPTPSYGTYLATKTISVTQIWQRFTITFTGQAAALWIRVTDTGTEYDIWLAQLEAGAFPTSPIPTTDAQVTRAADTSTSSAVTRAADIASVNELSPWYNPEQGTLFVEWSKLGDKAFQTVVTMASDTANFVSVGHGGDGKLLRVDIYKNATANANLTAVQSTTAGIIYKTAYSLSETGLAVSTNGSPAVEDTSILLPSVAHMLIGGSVVASNRQLNGHIRSLRVYPIAFPEAELQALSA